MKKSQVLRWSALSAVMVAFGALSLAATESRPPGQMGVAKPSKESNVTFAMPGKIRAINVKEGQEVKEGQVLAQLLNAKEVQALAMAKFKAENTISVEAEMAVRDQKAAQLIVMKSRPQNTFAPFEVQNAELEVTVADARIKLAKQQREEDLMQVELQKIALDWTEMHAPFDGVVQTIMVKLAESTDGVSKPVVRLIQNDPLWVEVPVPMAEAQRLKKGDEASVYLSATDRRKGNVLLVFPNVDTGSQTILVRVEVANPQKTQSGGIVYVNFGPANVAQK